MDLYLIRHAAAFKRDLERWPRDADRPLTPESEEDFRVVARGLRGLIPDVDLLLSSPFARAWRTAEILAEETSWADPGLLSGLEPEFSPRILFEALQAFEGPDSIALVGHRPSLHELTAYLLTGSEDWMNVGIKKGGAVCLRFTGPPEPGAAKLRWLLTPEILRAIAKG